MLYRSRRIEDLFGGILNSLSYQDILDLIGHQDAAEAEDLDYKAAHYALDDKGREELAKDVTALANHLGGVLVLGMAEVSGVPSKARDVDLDDRHLRHMQQVVSSNTAPPVRYEVLRKENPSSPGHGFMLLTVPRSPYGPHAITVPPAKASQHVLRYPRRSGSKTDWLSEATVATAYRERFLQGGAREERLAEVERNLLVAVRRRVAPNLLLVITPESPGDMTINQESFTRHRNELLQTQPYLGVQGTPFGAVHVGSRRLIAEQPDYHGKGVYTQLHRDGSGAAAVPLSCHTEFDDKIQTVQVDEVAHGLLSALVLLARHARDRAGAAGTALLKASLVDELPSHPNSLPIARDRTQYALTLTAPGGPMTRGTLSCACAQASATALLDDLADAGAPLVQAASHLADELVQAYGLPEAHALTAAGEIRLSGWSTTLSPVIAVWAAANNVTCL
ncbi:helix-turn-helix domain-containing protein [Streptacidiphilus sp. N1-3]|uniref:Helix-turn-helix domain-containing protein n=1 Tax=Streptacidiphilus alkalitolerans TaxID=3342712 RepID=A0ABV6X3H5_9ACTN